MDMPTASNCSHKCTLDLELTKEDLKVNHYQSLSSIRSIISFISAFMEEVMQIYDHDDDCCFDPTWNDYKANNTVMMFGSSGFVNSTGYFEPAHMIFVQ